MMSGSSVSDLDHHDDDDDSDVLQALPPAVEQQQRGMRERILGQLIGNLLTCLILGAGYLNVVLFRDFVGVFLWAFITSSALQSGKRSLLQLLQRYAAADSGTNKHQSPPPPLYRQLAADAADWARRTFANSGTLLIFVIGNAPLILASVGIVSMGWRVVLSALVLAAFGAALVVLLGRRIFFVRRLVPDGVLVTSTLLAGALFIVIAIGLFLGERSVREGFAAFDHAGRFAAEACQEDSAIHLPAYICEQRHWITDLHQEERKTELMNRVTGYAYSCCNESAFWPILEPLVLHLNSTSNITSHAAEGSAHNAAAAAAGGGGEGESLLLDASNPFSSIAWSSSSDLLWSLWVAVRASTAPMMGILLSSLGVVKSLARFGSKSIVYFTTVWLLLNSDNVLDMVLRFLLPMEDAKRARLTTALERNISGVFHVPLRLGCLRALVTLISFNLLGVQFPYLATASSFLLSVVPLLPPFVVCWPWVIVLAMAKKQLARAVILGVSQYFVFGKLQSATYAVHMAYISPYFSGLAAVVGYAVFRGTTGVLLGPLIISLALMLKDFLEDMTLSMQAPLPAAAVEISDTRSGNTETEPRAARPATIAEDDSGADGTWAPPHLTSDDGADGDELERRARAHPHIGTGERSAGVSQERTGSVASSTPAARWKQAALAADPALRAATGNSRRPSAWDALLHVIAPSATAHHDPPGTRRTRAGSSAAAFHRRISVHVEFVLAEPGQTIQEAASASDDTRTPLHARACLLTSWSREQMRHGLSAVYRAVLDTMASDQKLHEHHTHGHGPGHGHGHRVLALFASDRVTHIVEASHLQDGERVVCVLSSAASGTV